MDGIYFSIIKKLGINNISSSKINCVLVNKDYEFDIISINNSEKVVYKKKIIETNINLNYYVDDLFIH